MVEGEATGRIAHVRALRPLHLVKNLLVLLPWLAHHGPFDAAHVVLAVTAFVAFTCVAAGTYLVNDVLDRDADRNHPRKRTRPAAEGSLGVLISLLLAAGLFAVGLAGAYLRLAWPAVLWLALYLALALGYSGGLKRVVLLDVLVLTALYEIRILFGGAGFGIWVSPWLLGLTGFLFLSLAFLKRYAELRVLGVGDDETVPGRGYVGADLAILRVVGPACGCLAVLVLALYATSDQVTRHYRTPDLLWLACPALLYWIVRLWLLAHRGRMDDDPVVFALKDPASWAVAAFVLAVGVAGAMIPA